MKKIVLSIVCSMFFLVNVGIAQESYMVHIDKPFYITGEKVLFKLYYPQLEGKAVVRVLLVNGNDKVMQDFYAESMNASFLASCLSVPFNYESGTYRLIFNSNFKDKTQDEERTLAEIAFPIYSDLSAEKMKLAEAPVLQSMQSSDLENDLNIGVSVSKTNYTAREKVDINFSISDKSGQPAKNASVSVAVIKKDIQQFENEGLNYVAVGASADWKALPTLSEEVYYKGKVFNKGGRPVQLSVIGAYADQYKSLQYTKSKPNGAFTMGFPSLSGKQSVQFLNYEKEIRNFDVKLDSAVLTSQLIPTVFYKEEIGDMIARSKARKKMNQYFDISPSAEIIRKPSEVATEDESDITFVVNEYEKFDRVYDFFTELITPLTFKTVKKKKIATMNNPKSNYAVATTLEGNPLFIIDGRMTRDADYAGELKMSNIESIELVYSPLVLRKRFNVLGLSGVVIINTITPVFDFPKADSEDIFLVNGLQGDCNFKEFDASSADTNVPAFQSTVYWNAEVITDSAGKANISFDHTDDLGDFSIIVVGQDTNGDRGKQVAEYSVIGKNVK